MADPLLESSEPTLPMEPGQKPGPSGSTTEIDAPGAAPTLAPPFKQITFGDYELLYSKSPAAA